MLFLKVTVKYNMLFLKVTVNYQVYTFKQIDISLFSIFKYQCLHSTILIYFVSKVNYTKYLFLYFKRCLFTKN